MIEMPVFENEDWYLETIKDLLADKRCKNKQDLQNSLDIINATLAQVIEEQDFSDEIKKHSLFEKLILAPYKDLKKIYEKIKNNAEKTFFKAVVDGKEKRELKEEWKKIYGIYDKFVREKKNIELVRKYGIKSCPYCNANYIMNRGREYATAQLDHFYPRDKFPIFAVSLYNLVPVCSACNHIKSKNVIGLSPHDHSRNFSNMKISYVPHSVAWMENADEIEVNFIYNVKDAEFTKDMRLNVEMLTILPLYNEYKDYIQELLKKSQIYNKERREDLLQEFPQLFSSEEEVLRIVFGNYIETKDFLKRPLSKLTQDLLRELEVI